jgi:hypothetical protein
VLLGQEVPGAPAPGVNFVKLHFGGKYFGNLFYENYGQNLLQKLQKILSATTKFLERIKQYLNLFVKLSCKLFIKVYHPRYTIEILVS